MWEILQSWTVQSFRLWIFSAGVVPARIFPWLEPAPVSPVNDPAYLWSKYDLQRR